MQDSAASHKPSTEHENVQTQVATRANYAEVAVPVHVFQTFTYRLPFNLQDLVQVGARIVVPLGRRLVTGYVVALHSELLGDQSIESTEIKEASEILDSVPVLTPELLTVTRWVSEYYAAPWGEVIKAALPPGISPSIEQHVKRTELARNAIEIEDSADQTSTQQLLNLISDDEDHSVESLSKLLGRAQTLKAVRELERDGLLERTHHSSASFVKTKRQRAVRLAPEFQNSAATKLSAAQQRIIHVLEKNDSMLLQQLLITAEVGPSTVNTLQNRGVVEFFEQDFRRDPLGGKSLPRIEDYQLTKPQTDVLDEIQTALRNQIYAPFLLHGVTGSGKTEVYIRAMRLALELDRSALMLVPEIALTPVFSRRLRAHFGDRVAIFHSSLSRGERFDEWTRVRNGAARVVIGTRSAVFAPVENLGLVVIDEEHESSYRQQDSPQYHGRDTAIVRARTAGAVVVLGSATPSLESFHNASTGKYRYLALPHRIANRPMAAARLVDMRAVFSEQKKPQVFSQALLKAIEVTAEKGEQSIVLLNRRGYSSSVLCRSCGETVQCPNCDVTLTYHRSERVIVCHYCNHRQAAPSKCPSCDGQYIYYLGEGTEQIEELLKQRFPTLRIARIDRDTVSRHRSFERTLQEFSDGQLDMLVGTQMLAKGHDYPNVTLVGVVSVDAGLAMPDFRAAEKTFQLITQVAGRAGRGELAGQVLIQTYHPEHYALRHASAQDYQGFYDEEIRHRENLGYPPYVSLASILIRGPELERVRADALILRKELDIANAERISRILGPAPAPLAKLKGEHRFQILIKARNRKQLREIADRAIRAAIQSGINARSVNLEIDPVSMM